MGAACTMLRIFLTALLVAGGGSALAQTWIGTVTDFQKQGYVVRLGALEGAWDPEDDLYKVVEKGDRIYTGDILGALKRKGKVFVSLRGLETQQPLVVKAGEIKLALQDDADLAVCPQKEIGEVAEKLKLEVERGTIELNGDHSDLMVKTNAAHICPLGTSFEVRSLDEETQVFVFAGEVQVSSLDLRYVHRVPAGHWISASVGRPIHAAKPFTAVAANGPGSGTTECIQSDCTKIHKVPVPDPPVYRSPIFAPGPNPPGLNPPGGR